MATPISHSAALAARPRRREPRRIPLGVSLLLGLAFSAAVWGVAILGALREVGWIAAGRHG